MKNTAKSTPIAMLRQKAEAMLKNKSKNSENTLSDIEILKLIHELDVHQVELEMQNDELLLAKSNAEAAAEKYANLYDFAPSGYFTLSNEGEIEELNFRGASLLGKERSLLLKNRFGSFISDETRPIFILFLEELFDSETKQNCEVILSIVPNNPTYVSLSGILSDDGKQCLVTMHDISLRKNAEKTTKISEEKYRNIFEMNRDSITIFRIGSDDKVGNFIEANPATTTLFGYTKKDLMSMSILDIEKVTEAKRIKRIKTLKSRGRIDFETTIQHKNGFIRTVEIETLLINYLNEPAVMNITRDITERKQTEEKIRKAQESLSTILDAIPDILFEVGFDGRIYHYQAHRENLLALPPSKFMGKLFQEVLPADVSKTCMDAIEEADKKGWSTGKQYVLDLKQGRCWFEISVSPIKENNNKDKHFILIARDITDRKMAEEKLRTEKERIRTILELVGNPIFLKDNNHKITYANSAFCNLFGMDEESVFGKTLAEHVPEEERQHFFKIDRNVLDTGTPDLREEKLTLKGKEHTIITSKTRFIDESGNKSLVCSIYDITDRKKAEESLQKSQEKLRGVFDLANSGIILTDLKGKYLLFNNWLSDALGYTRKEMNKLTQEDITIPDDLENSNLFFNKLIEGKIDRYQLEKRFVRKDKSYFWAEISVSAIKDKNKKTVNTIGIITDITERRETDEKLKESERFAISTLDALSAHIAILDENGTILAVNNAWRSFRESNSSLGLNPTEKENYLSVCETSKGPYSDEAQAMVKGIRSVMYFEQDEFSLEYPCHSPTEKRWFNARVTRFLGKGDLRIVVAHENITERKLAEEKRIASEEFLNQTQIIANLGSYSLDFTTKKWTSTAILDNIFGIDADFERTIEGWASIIHPEWRTFMTDYLNNEVIGNKVNFNKEYKIIKIDSKEERWVHGNGVITFDKKGQPLQLIGSILDISERKKVLEKLKLTSEKFQDLVNSTGGIVWEADATTIIFTYVSQEAERLLGYPVEDWYKEGFWVNNLHPDDKKETIEYCLLQTKLMQKHDFKYRFKTKKGNYIWLRDIVNVITENGKPRWLRGVMFDISEQIETNQSLLESEEKYRSLVENSPDAIIIYVEDKIVYLNDEGLRMIGAENKEEIIGQSVLQYIHPDSLESVIQRMKDVILDKNASATVEERFINKYGTPFDVEIKAIPVNFDHKTGVQVIVHDITDRKHTQEKIRQLSQAVEQSPVSIIITNTMGEIEYVNPKFIDTTGYTLDEVKGQNPRILKSDYTNKEEYSQLWQTLISGKEWHGEFQNKKKDGSIFWESASISPIVNLDGNTTHYIAIKEDITQRKIEEQELIKAKLKAEESDRLKLAFLANMSHEIRTPMNGILGFTELLKEPKLSGEEQQEYINIIEKSGKRMLNIINDIISISKVESGQIDVSIAETNVNEQIEYLNTFFKPETKQKGIQLLVTKQPSPEESFVLTDKEKLYAVLTNLVKNAIKFTNEGSIEFGCEKKGKYLEFYVKDSGIGISKSQQELVFERFRQANESMTRTHEGSGLGLAISKAYIEMLGGTIWVESEEGIGSTFYFTLPFDTEYKPNEINIKKKGTIIIEENKINDLKVLIVEDDNISKLLITIAVKPYSKEIIKVSTGFEAIEACRNNPDIDLVMMDINMPEMGGYEATKLIRQFNKEVVIIAQTANGMQSDREEAIAAGCTDYISKPINFTTLSEIIHKHFKK